VRGIRLDVYPRGGYPCFSSAIRSLRTLGREKYRGRIIGGGPWKFLKSKIYEHLEE